MMGTIFRRLAQIAGEEIEVDTDNFENDFETFRSRDDVLTLLIHLGYLTWDRKEKTARIPNEEIKAEFRKILKGGTVNRKRMELIGTSIRDQVCIYRCHGPIS